MATSKTQKLKDLNQLKLYLQAYTCVYILLVHCKCTVGCYHKINVIFLQRVLREHSPVLTRVARSVLLGNCDVTGTMTVVMVLMRQIVVSYHGGTSQNFL